MTFIPNYCPVCGVHLGNDDQKDEDKRAFCSVACCLIAHPELHPNLQRGSNKEEEQ